MIKRMKQGDCELLPPQFLSLDLGCCLYRFLALPRQLEAEQTTPAEPLLTRLDYCTFLACGELLVQLVAFKLKEEKRKSPLA